MNRTVFGENMPFGEHEDAFVLNLFLRMKLLA